MTCSQCGFELTERGDGQFPECLDCGHIEYDAEALALMREVERGYKQAQRDCWPEPVPADYHTQEAETERMQEAWRLKRA
jgi:Homoserine O-succinyltransferase